MRKSLVQLLVLVGNGSGCPGWEALPTTIWDLCVLTPAPRDGVNDGTDATYNHREL